MTEQLSTSQSSIQKNSLSAVNPLSVAQLGLLEGISFDFELAGDANQPASESTESIAWRFQAQAKQALSLGLRLSETHVLALSDDVTQCAQMCGDLIQQYLESQQAELEDIVAAEGFSPKTPIKLMRLPAGLANDCCQAIEQWLRGLQLQLMRMLNSKVGAKEISALQASFSEGLTKLNLEFVVEKEAQALADHFVLIANDFDQYLDQWAPSGQAEGDPMLELILSESFIGRYRINVLVCHEVTTSAPYIIDHDPGVIGVLGGLDTAADHGQSPMFMRLRAGSLMRAHGGVLQLNLRDLLADEVNATQLVEKLYRFCRSGTLHLEDQAGSFLPNQALSIDLSVKVVLIASRNDYYDLLEEEAALLSQFSIRAEFADAIKASTENYQHLAAYIALYAKDLGDFTFGQSAIKALMRHMHRVEESQTRFSSQFSLLQKVMQESALLSQDNHVSASNVQAAIASQQQRNSYVALQVRETIVDQELMINVSGEAVGQVNGLTYIELAEASFGSPVRITANCYPGLKGVVTIDREATMSGPAHDKGVLIMQSWLQQHFASHAPLNFTASLVFEQEYSVIDGDSASCAELFALMSALTQLPINQSIAVTGGLNQHGEVIPVGGINEKIEGYFHVCQAMGFTAKQGVLIPEKNAKHLVLEDAVLDAVAAGDFHIATMSCVEEGLMYLMDTFMEDVNHHAAKRLAWFKAMIENNQPHTKVMKDV